jgi:hypothetical protein
MMSLELKGAYDNLSINDKRDQLSNEIIFIAELIKAFREKLGTNIFPFDVKNYDSVEDENMNEEEFLTFVYEDIYNIKTELVTILSAADLIEKTQQSIMEEENL